MQQVFDVNQAAKIDFKPAAVYSQLITVWVAFDLFFYSRLAYVCYLLDILSFFFFCLLTFLQVALSLLFWQLYLFSWLDCWIWIVRLFWLLLIELKLFAG